MAVAYIVPETLATFTGTATDAQAKEWVELNGTWLKSVIDGHKAWLNEKNIAKYQAAYDGYLEEIEAREKSRGDGINHRLHTSYAQLVIDTVVDYMVGNAIVWTVEAAELAGKEVDELQGEEKQLYTLVDEYRTKILKKLKGEEAQRVLREQLTQGSIAGYSTVITWVDENGNIDYEEFPAQEVVPIYDTKGRLRMVIRYYEVDVAAPGEESKNRTKVEVYDPRYVSYYLSDETGIAYSLDDTEVETGNPIEHKAGRIPVSIFVNGTPARYEERTRKNGASDLEGVFSILEEYAHVMSDKGNTVERLLDQYLVLSGVDTDEKEVKKMHLAKAIALKSKESKAEFIAPKQEDTAVENHLNRLRDTMHDLTFTPKLNNLNGATAMEIKMKYAALDIKAGKKETYFTQAIRQLVQVITDMLNYEKLVETGVDQETIYDILAGRQETSTPLYTTDWIAFTLNRNLPQNYLELSQIVAQLAGMVPDMYLYELLWFIEDPVAALEEMKKQKEQQRQDDAAAAQSALGYGGEFGQTGTVD